MRALLVCDKHGTFHKDLSPEQISEVLPNKQETIWLDINQPTDQDIAVLRDEFHFHPLAIEDATRTHERPKVEAYDKYYFIVFYAACYNDDTGHLDIEPLNLFVGPNYLVSVHKGAIQEIDQTLARWQHANSPISSGVGALLYALLDAVVDDYFPLMDNIAEKVEDLEDQIFAKFSEEAIESIFSLKKDLLRLRRVVTPERDVMNVLLRREISVFQQEDIAYLQDLYDHVVRVADIVDTYRDLLSSALDSYLSLQSNRLNQIVKVLTITSIVLMADALIAGIYGMNFEFMPELHLRFGYGYALGLMVVVSGALVLLFRRMKWL